LDPTWQIVDRPTTQGAPAGWFQFSESLLHLDPVYPITIDN